MKNKSASKASIKDFRDHVSQSLGPASGVLINLLDVLAIGPRPVSPVELTLSPLWGYQWRSLYNGVNRAGQELAETISDDDWLQELRKQRLRWLASQEISPINQATGKWRVRILDATDYPRPKTETVKLGYVPEGRVQVWVEMVAAAFWFLWALRAMAETETEKLPGWWRSGCDAGSCPPARCRTFVEFGMEQA